MMAKLPEPLTPPECDLTSMEWFPFYHHRLLQSEFWTTASDRARAISVGLWAESYRQIPAASLPSHDVRLARLAGFGERTVDMWLEIKDEVMSPWVFCSDERWYHPVLAEIANQAWESKRNRQKKPSRCYAYFIGEANADTPIKIGVSVNPWARLKQLQTASPMELAVLANVRCLEITESELHRAFGCYRTTGEWFARSPALVRFMEQVNAGANLRDELLRLDEKRTTNETVAAATVATKATTAATDSRREESRDSPVGESTSLTLFDDRSDQGKPTWLDPSFDPPADWLDEAMTKGRLSPEETALEWDGFKAYWLEQAGKTKGKKRDWKRTWINYVTSDICQKRVGARRRNNPSPGGSDGRPHSLVARTAERYR